MAVIRGVAARLVKKNLTLLAAQSLKFVINGSDDTRREWIESIFFDILQHFIEYLSDMFAVVYAVSLAPLPKAGLLGGWLQRRFCAHSLACKYQQAGWSNASTFTVRPFDNVCSVTAHLPTSI